MNSDTMKSALSKIAVRKAVGVYVGDQELAVCKVASTPFGIVQVASSCDQCTADDLPGAIDRLVLPQLGRRHRCPVAVGLPASRLFFGTRLVPSDSSASAESVLQKALCSSNISVEDLTVDLLRGKVNKLPVAGVVACRRKYIAEIVSILDRVNIRPFRSEPAPCAMVRIASHQHRPPRRAKSLLRVFLNATHALAVVVVGDLPVAWRSFVLPTGMEGHSILSAVRTLQSQHQHYGIDSALDYAIIHGRSDLHARLQQEQFASDMATRVLWHEGPTLDAPTTAFGLALGCLAQEPRAFDLSRSLKSRAPIKEIFPWGEMDMTAGLVGCMAVALGAHAVKLEDKYVKLKAENSQHACLASGDLGRLEKERKAMSAKVEAARTFFEGRMQWSRYIQDLSERLPSDAEITLLNGRSSLKTGNVKESTAGLELLGTAHLANGGAIPRDVGDFLRAIQRDPLWQRDFSSIATDIKLPLSGSDTKPDINFSINCARSNKPAGKSTK